MASIQTIDFFRQFRHDLKGPALEIGSLVQDAYFQHVPREIHGDAPPEHFIGIDIFPGKGVDYVCNLTRPEEVGKLPFSKYKTIHAHYVFEHVTDIFGMARIVEDLLDDDGVLLFSVPFAWRIHRIPIDMWRFTPQGIDYLFPNVEFIDARCCMHTRYGKKYHPVRDAIEEFNLGNGLDRQPAYIKYWVKMLRKLGLHNDIFNERALLFESNLCMYGVKRKEPTYTYIDKKYL
jgi:hypothetical protein